VSLQSDYRIRGYSMSHGQPAALLNLSYDHDSGVYLNGVAIVGRDREDSPAVTGVVENIGYARRLSSRTSADVGVVHSEYFQRYGTTGTGRYTEAYVGLTSAHLSSRLSYSPDYFRHGISTLYGEVNGGWETVAGIRLDAHIGYLDCLEAPRRHRCTSQYDWRLGLSRQFGPLDLSASLSDAESKRNLFYQSPDRAPAFVVGASWAF